MHDQGCVIKLENSVNFSESIKLSAINISGMEVYLFSTNYGGDKLTYQGQMYEFTDEEEVSVDAFQSLHIVMVPKLNETAHFRAYSESIRAPTSDNHGSHRTGSMRSKHFMLYFLF